MERERILLLTPRLSGGGAEQVMTLLARGLSKRNYDVHLALMMCGDGGITEIPAQIEVHRVGAGRARYAGLRLLQLIWRLHPQVVLSSSAEISFIMLLLRPFFPRKTQVLVRQNSTASTFLASGSLPSYTRLLYRLLYRRADKLICQSEAMAEDLRKILGVDSEEIAVLPNPVDIDEIRAVTHSAPSARSGKGPHLLAAGRLSREKGFDLLLDAMTVVLEHFPGADLIIAGSGSEEQSLKQQSRRLRLEGAVSFPGRLTSVYPFFAGATLFVLPSRFEGMPNALLEAAAAGLPLVATPASGGIVKLLRDEPGAWITPEISAEALAVTLIVALSSLQQRARFNHSFFPPTPK